MNEIICLLAAASATASDNDLRFEKAYSFGRSYQKCLREIKEVVICRVERTEASLRLI